MRWPRTAVLFAAAAVFSLAVPAEETLFHVVIDAGHDSSDPGVTAAGLTEKDATLELARALAEALKNRPGLRAVLTRKGDYPLSLDERRRIANSNSPGVFLSLHFSRAPSPGVGGPRVFLLSGIETVPPGLLVPVETAHIERSSDSLTFANTVAEELTAFSADTRMAVAHHPLAQLTGVTIPAILIEADVRDPQNRELFVAALAKAIDRYLSEGKNPGP